MDDARRYSRKAHTRNHRVVAFIRLKSDLFERLEVALTQHVDLLHEDGFRCDCRVNTAGLDGDNTVTAVLQEIIGVQGNDTGLVRLGDIGKDDIDGGEKHAVFLRCTSILDDGWRIV